MNLDAAALAWLAGVAFRATVVMAAAGAVGLLLHRAPARLRGTVWAAALAGVVLLPLASTVLPPLEVPLPAPEIRLVAGAGQALPSEQQARQLRSRAAQELPQPPLGARAAAARPRVPARPLWPAVVVLAWAAGALAVAAAQAVSAFRLWRLVGRAAPLEGSEWRAALESEARRVGLARAPRLVMTDRLAVPATAGLIRPVVLLPEAARCWVRERRAVVLRHELVHVARWDWAVRLAARGACSLYWFNPLVWWAWRRLAIEQELACDQEVLALGVRPSSYAAHLLAVARAALARPAAASSALEMARRSHLEGRIMAILDPSRVRRIGAAVLVPAVILTLGIAAAVAAVRPAAAGSPGASEVRASRETREIVRQMRDLEERIEERARDLENVEEAMQPRLEAIEAHAERIGRVHGEELEARLEPLHRRMRELEEEMEPLHAEMAALAASVEPLELRMEIDTGVVRERLARLEDELAAMGETIPFDQMMERIHEMMEPLHEQVAAAHLALEPGLAELEGLHERLEPFHRRMEEIHLEMEPILEQIQEMHLAVEPELAELEGLDEALEPLHREIEAFQREIEPLTEELEGLADRLRGELSGEVRSILERELAAVVDEDAPFGEAAERLLQRAGLHLDEDVLELRISSRESRRVLLDLMAPARRSGTTEAELEAAVDAAADAVRRLEVRVD